jgi:SAM-dependent methyltransferase
VSTTSADQADTDTRTGAGESTGVTDIFDKHYEQFWRHDRTPDEQVGEIAMIKGLAGLGPGSTVLDLACAFGRIGNVLAADGIAVTGVDISEQLLATARAEAPGATPVPVYVNHDIRRLTYAGEFDAVLLWSTALGYTEEADDDLILAGAFTALKPGGTLLIETRHWDAMHRAFQPATVRIEPGGTMVERHGYDPETGQQVTWQRILVGGESADREYRLRRYGFPELRAACRRAGFADVTGFDETGGRLRIDSRRCVVVARKADAPR